MQVEGTSEWDGSQLDGKSSQLVMGQIGSAIAGT